MANDFPPDAHIIKSTTIEKGAVDSSFGYQNSNNSLSPKAIKNTIRALTPTEAYQLCSSVRSAIRARNALFNQVKIRLFTRNGKEITGGPAYEFWKRPNPCMSGPSFIQNMACWNDLAGERMSWVHKADDKKTLIAHVLNPIGARIMEPVNPKLPEHIKKWQYTWENGYMYTNIPNEQICYEFDFNPSSICRGASPLVSVINSISSHNFAQRYIRSYFGNNGRPSTIINVDTDNPDIVTPFKQEFMSTMQGEENAWGTFFTYGSKVTVEPLEPAISDAPFQNLLRNVQSEVASLYMTPPLVAGIWDVTRFDSAREQNNWFMEGTFLPHNEMMQNYCQRLNDKHLRFTNIDSTRSFNFSKSMDYSFEKARDTTTSDIVVILDTNHIPSIVTLKMSKLDHAERLQNVLKVTSAQAAAECNIDINLNDAANLVWYNTSQKFVDHVRKEQVPVTPMDIASIAGNTVAPPAQSTQEQVADQDEQVTDDTSDPQSDDTTDNKSITNSSDIKTFYRELWKLSTKASDGGEIWTLFQADELALKNNTPYLETLIREDYLALFDMVNKGNKEEINTFFKNKLKNIKVIKDKL